MKHVEKKSGDVLEPIQFRSLIAPFIISMICNPLQGTYTGYGKLAAKETGE